MWGHATLQHKCAPALTLCLTHTHPLVCRPTNISLLILWYRLLNHTNTPNTTTATTS